MVILIALFQILLGDPGHITKKMIFKIYKDNNIDVNDIGTKYKIEEVYEMLSENYLKE